VNEAETTISERDVPSYARTLVQARRALKTAEATSDEAGAAKLRELLDSTPYKDERVVDVARRLALEKGEEF